MKLSEFHWHEEQGAGEVSFRVQAGDGGAEDRTIRFRLPGELLGGTAPSGDFAVAVTLLAAMKKGDDLDVAWPICPRLSAALPELQDIYAVWGYGARRAVVRAPEGMARLPLSGPGVACFFTGGVDSWYTVLKHRDEITHLVYVHGFDVLLSDTWRRERVSSLVRQVAAGLGKKLVEVETDLRAFSDPVAKWDYYHGAGLAAVALLLGNAFHKVYIPATFTYADLVPLGSHPMLDPLWSTEAVSIVHDGCEASRLDKIRVIFQEPLVRETLRVCWRNVGQSLNCGVCEKCLRTMICLEIAGVSCATLPQRLDLSAIEAISLNERWRTRYEQLRVGAERAGKQDLSLAIGRMLKRKPTSGPGSSYLSRLRTAMRRLNPLG